MTTPNQSINFDHTNLTNGAPGSWSLTLDGNSGIAIFDAQAAGGTATQFTINNTDIDEKTKVDLNIVFPTAATGLLIMGSQFKFNGGVTFYIHETSGNDTKEPIQIDMKLW